MAEKTQAAYKIIMSRGNPIQIDADEMAKVISAMQNAQPCKVKQGIFNPSFYVEIVEDEERMKAWRDEISKARQHNKFDRNYNEGKNQKTKPELKPLKNIFEGVPLKLESSPEKKRLGN